MACVGTLYWGVNFLLGSDVFASHTTVYGIYNHTQGLDEGRPVTINGNTIGIVQAIDFMPDYSGDLVVSFQINTEYPIPLNSQAVITGDVLGNKRVEILLGDSEGLAGNGDTILTGIQPGLTEAVNEQLAPLKAKTERLLGSLDTALAVIQGFLTPETQRDFRSTFANLNQSFENMKSITEKIDGPIEGIVNNIATLTETLSANSGRLDSIFANMESLTDTLAKARIAQTMNELALAANQANTLLEKANNGEGTLGQLLNDQELYDNLTKASQSLDRLLLDFRYNPNRYVEFSIFGSSPRYSQEEIEALEADINANTSEDTSSK